MKVLDRFIGSQISKPSGAAGWLLGHLMANEHRALVDWMLSQLDIRPTNSLLDVGCGGGMTLKVLSGLAPQGLVVGLDRAPTMVRQARRRCRDEIRSGRVQVVEGDVTAMPFEDGRFDVVCGVETFYFWPEPVLGLREVLRVLKPGGRVSLVMDISKPSPDAPVPRDVGDRMGFHVYSGEEMVRLLDEAGFEKAVFHAIPERAKGWLCACADKPVDDVT